MYSQGVFDPLLMKPSTQAERGWWCLARSTRVLSLCGREHAVAVLVAATCMTIGVMHPLATEAAKSAEVTVCTVRRGGTVVCPSEAQGGGMDDEIKRRIMPFHAATLTVVAELVAVLLTLWIVAREKRSLKRALQHLVDPKALLQLCPIGLVYGLGDFLQTVACNAASAPVVLIVGQSKLLLAALLSRALLKSEQTNWFRLVVISCAAAAGTDIGAGAVAAQRQFELRGAGLAFLKAGLSCLGAVLSERHYKQADQDFWVVSFRVQLMMLQASILLLPWTCSGWESISLSEVFFGGPLPLCSDEAQLGRCGALALPGETCACVDRRGWDAMTWLAVLAIVLNGLTTGLTLKHLSAVSKSVCNALSTGVFYVVYVALGFRPFNMAQANVMAIVIISSYEYALEKAELAAKRCKKTMLPS
mmetsp:Transcript_3462/g.10755  ORF Transcript_3462/g.10755 Transcript_3462/m.10755 type:complete len:418 (+) Transcript_3462:61-1314(+)